MSLITTAYIKQNFPQWEHYAEHDTQAADPDAALENTITNAEIELGDYITVTEDTITPAITRHLFHLVRKNLFDLKHADTEFDHRPEILKDYEKSIQMLTALRQGERPSTPPTPGTAQGGLKITGKKRRFNTWFRDNGNPITSSDDV